MNTPVARCIALSLLVILAACAKKAEPEAPKQLVVAAVPEAERSRHFEAVNSHLELGGVLYGYVDVDGDLASAGTSVQALAKQLVVVQPQLSMFAKQDFKALMDDLGLTDVKAVGVSSVLQAGGTYRNRAFLYTPEGRHGLFAVFGGQSGRFTGTRLAPADVDFYAEHEFDVVAVYDTIKGVIAKVNGPAAAEAFEKQVKEAGSQSHFSLLNLIEGLNGRATFILRMDPVRNVAIPLPGKPVLLPAFSALVRVDGIGSAVEAAFAQSSELEASTEGTLHLFTYKGKAPVEGLRYVVAVDGATLYFATTGEFLHECLARTSGLDANPEFVAALAALGPEGNGLTWVTPRFFARFKELATMNAQADVNVKRLLDLYAANIPTVSQPLLSVRTNLSDGILLRSTWNRSLKADVAMLTIYNPVTVGLMAAMAIPAFQKVRTESQAKAVTNNLRALHAAANQYYRANGVTTATYDDLVGPDKPVKVIVPVAGEDYRKIRFAQGQPIRVHLPDGRVISYPSFSSIRPILKSPAYGQPKPPVSAPDSTNQPAQSPSPTPVPPPVP
jgi:type IV pilus assembly protein PilA